MKLDQHFFFNDESVQYTSCITVCGVSAAR